MSIQASLAMEFHSVFFNDEEKMEECGTKNSKEVTA